MILVALFSALTAVGAFIKIPTPLLPITLQTLFTMLAGMLLGPKRGALAVLIYILLGLAGLPIFTQGGGIGYVFKPSFGYLIGMCVAAYISGVFTWKIKAPGYMRYVLAGLAGTAVIYAVGLVYFYIIANFVINSPIGVWPLLLNCFLLTLPGDIALVFAGSILAQRLRPVLNV